MGGGGFHAKTNSRWQIFAVGDFVEPSRFCAVPPASPQCVLLVWEKLAENPEFRVGNFVVNLKREISHAKLKCHEIKVARCRARIP